MSDKTVKASEPDQVLNPPRPLNNAQRKALADIVEKRLGSKAEDARRREKELEQEITLKIARRFKVDTIAGQIKKLQADIKNLEKARDELGFSFSYSGEDFRITGGQARKLLEAEVKENSLAIRVMEDARDSLKQRIWLAETIEDARSIVAEVDSVSS